MTRYRLTPTPEQESILLRHCAHARYVWNLAVEQHSHWRPGRQSAPGFSEHCRQLTAARAEHIWLRDGSQMVQQQALRDFGQAMTNFFSGTHGRPTWRKAGRNEGFRIVAIKPNGVRRLNRHTGAVRVPKAGWVRFRWSRQVPAGVKSCRITRNEAARLGRLQRKLALGRRGSNRRRKVRRAIAKLRARQTDRRRDWAEKVSTSLACQFDVIRVENLNVKNMIRSAKGTIENPGRNVQAKAGLNRSILNSGWGLLVHRLEDKAPGRVERVPAAFTSQRCSSCGWVDAKSRKSQAVFACTACGFACNADVNAAKNIAAGHAVTVRGGDGDARPVNREPQLLSSA